MIHHRGLEEKERVLIRSSYFLQAVLLCLAGATACWAQKPKPPARPIPQELRSNGWKEFYSLDGRFRILFPGKPVEQSAVSEKEAGRLEGRLYALEAAGGTYIAAYNDLSTTVTGHGAVSSMLDRGRDAALASGQGKLVSEKAVSVAGYPGREIKAEIPEGMILAKVYLVRQRLYQLIVFTPDLRTLPRLKCAFYESSAHKFLDSFRLIKVARDKFAKSVRRSKP